ncbi:MAG: nucleotide-binding universal stress UspA family protein [Myxococcota bacterium]|jgi:nucleotide-binding universal stress UspA family protein
MVSIKTIMVPVDGSEPSTRALDFALQIAGPLGATLDLVTVMDLGQLDFFDGLEQTLDKLDDWEARLSRDVLQPAIERAAAAGAEGHPTVLRGATYKVLLGHIESTCPSMVVMGRTERTAVNRILHGSVSRRLSTASSVPVVLVG